jgi:hypothetical protein
VRSDLLVQPAGVLPVSTSPELLIAYHTLCSTTQKP